MFNVHHRSERQRDVGNPATIAFLKLGLPAETEKCRHFFLPDKPSKISISPSTPVRHEAGSTLQHWGKRCFDFPVPHHPCSDSSPSSGAALRAARQSRLRMQESDHLWWNHPYHPRVLLVFGRKGCRADPWRKRGFAAHGGSTVGWR